MRGLRRGPPPPGALPVLRFLVLLLVAAALFFAMRPLLGPHQVSGHSTYSDLVRAEAFHQSISQGDWTPRWLPDFYFRHGSPLFHFYAPGAYYLIELLRRLGFSTLWAFKLAYLLPWLLGAWATWRLTSKIAGRAGAGVATVAYGLAPYLLIDVYMRNGIAEAAAFGLVPCALWATWRAGRKEGVGSWLGAALATAALALTHNITSLITTPILFGLAVVTGKRIEGKRRASLAVVLGLALAAFFWLPALLDKGQVASTESLTGGHFDYRQHFLDPIGVLTPSGGAPLAIGPQETAALQLGAPLAIGLLVALAALLVGSLRRRVADPTTVGYFLVAALVCLWMATPWAAWLWGSLPLLPFVQFPWRFLLPLSCLAAPLVGLAVKLTPRRGRRWVRIALTLLAISVATPYVVRVYLLFEPDPQSSQTVATGSLHVPADDVAGTDPYAAGLLPPHRLLTVEELRARGVTGTASHDFLPLGVEQLPTTAPPAAEVVAGSARVVEGGWGYPRVFATIEAAGEARVALGQFWFPGWRVTLDGEPIEAAAEPELGRILVTVPPGNHRIEARFRANSSVWTGYAVSLLAALALLFCIHRERRASQPTFILAAK